MLRKNGAIGLATGEALSDVNFFDDPIECHHLFPTAYAKRQAIPSSKYNCLVNLTPLSQLRQAISAKQDTEGTAAIGNLPSSWDTLHNPPDTWHLKLCPFEVHLQDIEVIQPDTPDGIACTTVIRLRVELGNWHEVVHIGRSMPGSQRQPMLEITSILAQMTSLNHWIVLGNFSCCPPELVLEELACLVLYVAQLFDLDGMAIHIAELLPVGKV